MQTDCDLTDAEQTRQDDEINERAEAVATAYNRHWLSIQKDLPITARLLAHLSFHDSYLIEIDESIDGQLRIRIDATNNPWGPTGWIDLFFFGVVECHGLQEAIGDSIIYEEVDTHGYAQFEYRALLEKGEISIACDSFDLICLGQSDPATFVT